MKGVSAAHARKRHGIVPLLVALAVAVRLLVPAGWMPATAQGLALTLCSGNRAETAWIDPAGKLHRHAPHDKPAQSADHKCAFAGMAPLLAAGEPAAVPAPPAPRYLTLSAAHAVSVGRGLAAPPPPSTGPPARAA